MEVELRGGGEEGKGTGEFMGNRSITEIEKERRIEYERERGLNYRSLQKMRESWFLNSV